MNLYQTAEIVFFRERNFEAEILSVQDKIYSQKLRDARNFIYRQSRTLDLLFAASPPDTLFSLDLPLSQAPLLAFTCRAWYHGYHCMHCFSSSDDTLLSLSTAGEWSLGTTQLFPSLLGRISSVGRALDSRAGSHGFDSRGRTNTQGLKITEYSDAAV